MVKVEGARQLSLKKLNEMNVNTTEVCVYVYIMDVLTWVGVGDGRFGPYFSQ